MKFSRRLEHHDCGQTLLLSFSIYIALASQSVVTTEYFAPVDWSKMIHLITLVVVRCRSMRGQLLSYSMRVNYL